MKILKFLIFFLFLNAAYSQSNKALIDSLKTELTSKINDTARAKVLGDLTWYYKEFSVIFIKHLTQGFTSTQIGETLFISPRTVDTHRTNIMRKIEVNNVASLIRFAFQNGLA
jgi:two-component system response regulator NreC